MRSSLEVVPLRAILRPSPSLCLPEHVRVAGLLTSTSISGELGLQPLAANSEQQGLCDCSSGSLVLSLCLDGVPPEVRTDFAQLEPGAAVVVAGRIQLAAGRTVLVPRWVNTAQGANEVEMWARSMTLREHFLRSLPS